MLAAERNKETFNYQNHLGGADAVRPTFDVPMQFSLNVKILEPSEEFTNDDGYVFFSKDAWFHLEHQVKDIQ